MESHKIPWFQTTNQVLLFFFVARFRIGKPSINGPFSMVLNNQRVIPWDMIHMISNGDMLGR
jgi:hypothetical protein